MTHDKVRQDFEAIAQFKHMDFTLDKDAWGREKYKHSHIQALFDGYQAGRAAERAEIREKLESEGECYTLHPSCMTTLSRQTFDEFLALVRHGAKFIDIRVRKDAKEYVFQADGLKYMKPPAITKILEVI